MAYRWTNDLTAADVTPKSMMMNRRQIMAGAVGLGAIGFSATQAAAQGTLKPNSLEDITTYNNYYEFGTGKDDPAKNAHKLVTSPWSIKVDGLVDNPGEYSVADLIDGLDIEERIYRFRCVEAWAMVVPWNGVELADVLKRQAYRQTANTSPLKQSCKKRTWLVFSAAFWIFRMSKACAWTRRCIR